VEAFAAVVVGVVAFAEVVVGVVVLLVCWLSFYDQEGMHRAAQSSTQQQKQQHLSLEE
jgi:hypothetical protein